MPAARRVFFLLFAILFLLLFLGVQGVSRAGTREEEVRELAARIARALLPAEETAVVMKNSSSLGAGEAGAVRETLLAELKARGVKLVARGAARNEVRVTISENPDGYLLVAQIPGGSPAVAMANLPRSAANGGTPSGAAIRLRKELVWEQEEPMLDLAISEGAGDTASSMLVLEPASVSLYQRIADRWEPRGSYALPAPELRTRDVRGRIVTFERSFRVYLPGMQCSGDLSNTSSTRCEQSSAPWPLQAGKDLSADYPIAAGRNYFSDRPHPSDGEARKIPPFFSAAAVKERDQTLWIYTRTDGRAVVDRNPNTPEKADLPEITTTGWGSDIVSVETNCGGGWQVLATRPGDFTETDAITVYEIADAQPAAVSPAVEFPGPVIALWTTSAGSAALAISRNLKTQRYEAYRLSIACGR